MIALIIILGINNLTIYLTQPIIMFKKCRNIWEAKIFFFPPTYSIIKTIISEIAVVIAAPLSDKNFIKNKLRITLATADVALADIIIFSLFLGIITTHVKKYAIAEHNNETDKICKDGTAPI